MNVLIVDCYDSFTYNLYQMVGQLNENPIVTKNDENINNLPKKIDRIILSPGPGAPENAGNCSKIIDHYEVPVLGVCLGHQVIAHKYGGAISKTKPVHGKTSEIKHDGSKLFKKIPKNFKATRYHSLKVEQPLPKEISVNARSIDENIVMSISHKTKPIFGVQFHPESIASNHGNQILKNFLYGV
ncbi:Anthranilate/para-aminobenzoate synthase component II TrpG [Methanonatronarchaeum thermophilum]|uniref:anthranilate synthase n=1 Tax=Methanonatronarchaeum thermophilum TaxID=1927129 RepID=A0A1Y3GDE0_9EURY|nr:aminodeoxychorismate/anthranilate synthase component II [Methanonatronarchaeum thermophilum]OUJ19419.1 Anthranilate/para-aminobenzoate synthase component II TrpG [Methanonatronarchaeum thermophilum]